MTREDGYRGGCTPRMAVARNPGDAGCHVRCAHRAMVEEYRDARLAWEARRESGVAAPTSVPGAGGAGHYQLTDEEYAAAYPPPTFRAWLEGRRGEREAS